MTDLHETRTVRSFAATAPRSFLDAAPETAQRLGPAIAARAGRPSFADPRSRADRALMAEGRREEARRKEGRRMM